MSYVVCFGEALIDFLESDHAVQDGLQIKNYRQFPGGAPANAAVALAKLGGMARFAGQVGQDAFGKFIVESLAHYGVNTRFTLTHSSAPTALAFVHLDDNGERSFTFKRKQSADLLLSQSDVKELWFESASILHICSNTLTDETITETSFHIVSMAKKQNVCVSIDVNLRPNLWPQNKVNIERVNRFVFQAELVKFSREEFLLLSEANREAYLKKCFEAGCQLILITDGGEGIEFITPTYSGFVVPPKVDVVDTTAGGDGFIGAMLYVLSDITCLSSIVGNKDALEAAVAFSSCAGAIAVSSHGAFPALATRLQTTQLFNKQFSALSSTLNFE